MRNLVRLNLPFVTKYDGAFSFLRSPQSQERERGQAMVEFAIVFPIQLFLTLAALQLAHFMIAKLVVNHAAYASARAALVIREGVDSDGNDWQARASDAINRAAITICSPITGASPPPADLPAQDPTLTVPGWDPLNQDWITRSNIAEKKTRVTILEPTLPGGHGTTVRVAVEHDFEVIFLPDSTLLSLWGNLSANNQNQVPLMTGNRYGTAPHVTLRETCTLARNWDTNQP
jgi:hypothetical protein